MKAHLRFLVALVLFTGLLLQNGNAVNKYSVATGNWSATSTWSLTSGGAPGAPVPVASDVVIIEGGFNVTVNANTAALTSLTISSGSTLTATVGYTVSATTITVNGTYINSSTGTLTGTMTVGSSGTYRHNINGGTLKAATWNTGSTCLVTGVTSTSLTVTGHSFSNFTWNSTNTAAMSLSPTAINGNLNVISGGTGTNTIRINTTPFTIGGDLSLSGTANFQIATSSTAKTLTVNGNFSMTGGTCTYSNGSGIGTLNIKGNYSHTGGTITETSTGSGALVFIGTSTQTYTSGGTVSNSINYTVNSGTTLQMADASTIVSGAAFTLNGLATLGIKSTAGITSSGATGNIQTTARSFTSAANYIYNGSSAQVTGSGLPSTVNNLTINNSAGVTASGNYTVSGILNLQSANASATQGCLEMSSYTLTMGPTATTTGTGDVTGTVKRTSFLVNTQYSFGNQFTTLTLSSGGILPTWVSVKLVLTPTHTWKTDGVNRYYDIAQSGGNRDTKGTLNLHYLDSELNGAIECDMDLFDYHISIPNVDDHGRTNNNSTDKWVGLGSMSLTYLAPSTSNDVKYWTLGTSLSGNDHIWIAAANSTDWNDAGNWSGGVPNDSGHVTIPAGLSYYPDITANATIGKLTIESGAILTITGSPTLTITGGAGAWDNMGTFNAGTSTVLFTNSKASMSDPTNFYNVTVANSAKLTLGTDNVMRIAGALSLSSNGILDAATNHNTVEYNGTNQTVVLPNGTTTGYHNLILSGSGTITMPSSTLNIYGDFSTSGSVTVTALGIINTYGNFTVGAGTIFNSGIYSHTIGGNLTNNGFFNSTGSTITFNSDSAAQTISGSTTTFNNLIISNPVSVTLNVNTLIAGDLNIVSGYILDLGAYSLNRSTSGGTLTLAGTLKLGANSGGQTGSNFPLNFGTVTMTGGTVEYYGSSQTVYTGTTYNNMTIGGSGSITLPSTDFTLDNLTVNNSNGLSLSGNITLNGSLKLTSGLLNLGSKNLTLGPTATIIGTPSATNMIVATGTGELRKAFESTGEFLYPVGSNSGTAEYTPVFIGFDQGLFSSAYVGIKVANAKHPNNPSTANYINRYWTITQSGITNFNCAVELNYVAADVVGTETDIWCGKYSGSEWTLLTAAYTEEHKFMVTGITGFSSFTGGEQGVLPVSLSSLSSSVNGRNINLNWITSSESNNAGFEIERAIADNEAPVYTKTGFVTGKGTTNTPTNYSFEDRNLNTGKYKYRLKQIDVNGYFEYHNLNGIVEVGVPAKYDLSQNYPNPFNPVTKINFELPYDSKVKMIIYDVTGREIKTIVNEIRTAGYHTIVYDGSMISSGIYFYRITANANGKDYISTKKMALIK